MSESRNSLVKPRQTSVSEVADNRRGRMLHNAWVLSKGEINRGWVSYALTTFVVLLIGFFVVSTDFFNLLYAWGEDTSRARDLAPSNGFLDFLFLFFTSNLAYNWFAEGWFFPRRDVFLKRYAYLRTLPIGSGALISGRALTTIFTLLLLSTTFFVPSYILVTLLATEQFLEAARSQLTAMQYLWFAMLWTMLGLVAGGFSLYLESGVRGSKILLFQLVWFLPFVFLALVVSPAVDGIVASSVRLVQSYGPIPAIIAILVGVPLFLLWTLVAKRRLERRDLEP